MKKIIILAFAAFIINGFISRDNYKSGIFGSIEPADGAKKVWALNGNDSFSAVPVMGKFSIETKPGTWRISVDAVEPGKNVTVDNILVQENQFTDAGVIKLPQSR
jgi:hypothetical protein